MTPDLRMETLKVAVALLGLLTGLAGAIFTTDGEVAVVALGLAAFSSMTVLHSVTFSER